MKTSILSGGQFHPVNISVLRAGPTLIGTGHPVRAVKGVVGTFTATKGRVQKMLHRAINDTVTDPVTGNSISYVDAAAKIGSPYMQRGYDTAGSKLKSGVGHKLVFEQQIPMMHDQVVRSVIDDLVKKGVSLDSEAAKQAGAAANSTMGFINKEALNIPAWAQKGMRDWMLASQFTPSKIVTMSKVLKGGVAGKYARADVISNVAAATVMIAGVGYLVHQKSDDLRDSLLRAVVDPAVPTPFKDKKGNTVELRIPATYTSEISKFLGLKLVRGTDGHLSVNFNPKSNIPSNVAEWMRARLSPLPSTALKVYTNTDFADKPLYDPNAQAGKKVIQAATTITQEMMPIGTQGLAYTDVVKNHLPGSAKEVLDANTPGSNPVIKSGLSSVGFTTKTDTTVGKGLQNTQYFTALDEAKSGLNSHEAAALELYSGSKKNPVTGKYEVNPSVYDAKQKASALLANPKVIDKLITLNKTLSDEGQSVDPLWSLPKDKITSYLQYSTMDMGGAQRSAWYNNNSDWYDALSTARNSFFSSLPASDPNKPKLDITYPQASSQVQSLMNQYNAITDTTQKTQFLEAHPEVVKQWNAQTQYTNDFLKEMGYSAIKGYPEASDKLQSFINQYSSADKTAKSGLRNTNPDMYKNMIAYFDSVNLYTIGKQAGVSALQGQPDYTSKEAKAISSLAQDIYKNADGTYSIVPAGWMDGLSNDSSYSSSSSSSSRANPYKYAVSINAGGTPKKVSLSSKKVALKGTKAYGGGTSKPKVGIKKSKV